MTHFNTLLATTILGAGLVQGAYAQVLTGKVTDASGEASLEGAIVSIEGLNRSTTTNRFGEYRLNNVPVGTYNVVIDYVGADLVTQEVVIPAEGASYNFIVGDDVRYLDNVLVVGSAAAQAGALNQQRASNSIISVIDSDGLGNFPDTTVADSLSRVAGLSIETDQGEGRYVSIRGINTDLIGASINGVRAPSPEDRRGVLLDGVPSDLLDGIRVQKSLTPDVDADSLGGIIDLQTISAFDRDGRFVRAKVEGRFNEISEELTPKATLTYSNVFNDVFGAAFSLNFQEVQIEAHNNESGEWGIDEDTGNYFLNDDYEHRWYDLTRQRVGFVANLDWRVTDNTELYFRSLFNQYTDDEVRNKFEFKDLDDGSPTSDQISIVPINEIDAEVRVREEVRQIQTISLGGQTEFDNITLDYEVSYAYADQDDSDNHDVAFRFEDIQDDYPDQNLIFDSSNPQKPVIRGSNELISAIYDPSNYSLDEFEREFTTNEDTEFAGKFDFTYDTLMGETPVEWKAGVKLRDREKVRDANLTFEEADLNLADFSSPTFITNWRLANPQPTWPDPALTQALRGNIASADDYEFNVDDSFYDSNAEDFTIDEQILAFYGMGTFDFGATTVVAGVRVEQTDVDMTGNLVAEEDLSFTAINFSDDYTHVLPSVNVKHAFADDLIARFAYYAAVVRPAFEEMAPFVLLNDDRDEAELGNPNLEALEADNFDVSLEFYPTDLSVISIGAFYKSIDNAIFEASFDIEDVPSNIDLSALGDNLATVEEISTFVNVGSSDVIGMEFNYVQQLGFLGDFWDGFLVSGNLTIADSETETADGREVPFLKQSDTVWNLSIGYDKGPWDIRLSGNYRGDYLDELVDENLDRYTDNRFLLEATAKYDVNDHLQIYLEGKNLTDEPEYYYFGQESRLSQYDEFGTTVTMGARYTF